MDDEPEDTIIKFDRTAKRRKNLNGGSPGNAPENKLLFKIMSTVVVVAIIALGYFAAR